MDLRSLRDGGVPLSAVEIAAMQERYGIVLPTEYQHFLSTQNGGCTYEYHVVASEHDPSPLFMLGELFAMSGDGSANGDRFIGIYRSETEERFPSIIDVTIPIGVDPGGSLLLLGVGGLAQGGVYLETHDTAEENTLLMKRSELSTRVAMLTESFGEFLSRLRPWTP